MEYGGDKCTVISIVPFPILMEEKPGMCPGRFSIPAAKNGIPQVLVVGKSTSKVPISDGSSSLDIDTAPSAVARSIVDDYLDSQLAASPDAKPGLTWLPGELTSNDVITKHSKLLTDLVEKQRRWFLKLVELADTDWARYKSHKVIADFQRHACKELGLTRDWAIVIEPQAPIKCPACGTTVMADVVVCPTCRCVLDKERHAKMTFA